MESGGASMPIVNHVHDLSRNQRWIYSVTLSNHAPGEAADLSRIFVEVTGRSRVDWHQEESASKAVLDATKLPASGTSMEFRVETNEDILEDAIGDQEHPHD